MALVVLLRGVNVGGHRRFRPSALAAQLKHLDAISIGATGTLVVRRPVTRTRLRAELTRRLPFSAEIVICDGAGILDLVSRDPLAAARVPRGAVRFVSVLTRRPRLSPELPMAFPSSGAWLVKILAREQQFVFGIYRRHMKTIGYLGSVDRLFGVRATTRSWSTITAIARILQP